MRRNAFHSLTQLGALAAVLGGLLFAPTPALAQDDVTLTMARERFKEGVAYFDKKDFAKARVAFLQAYALKKHPAVLLNLAQSELRSSHEADAAKHFAQYLREHKDATEAERQGAETGLTAAKALVAEVEVEVDINGAEVYVDGDQEGVAPLPGPIFLAPGSHQLLAKKEGKSATSQVNTSAGQSNSVKLRLTAPPPSVPVAATAPAEEGGSAPLEETSPPSHRPGFFPWLGHHPVAIVGAGVFGVGLIGGGAFAFASKSYYDSADSIAGDIGKEAVEADKKRTGTVGVCVNPLNWLKTESERRNMDGTLVYADPARAERRAADYQANCDKFSNNVKSGDTFKTLMIVSLATAGAAAAGTIIYYFVDTSGHSGGEQADRGSKRRVSVMPLYQPGFAGALVAGSF